MSKRYMGITEDNARLAEQQERLQHALASKDRSALEWMLGNKNGRWFLARLMKNEGMNARSFTGNSGTFYNEGRREVCVNIYESIKAELGLPGIKQLHQAQEEMMEFEFKAMQMAEMKEEDDE